MYVEPDSYKLLMDAKTSSEIDQTANPKHIYVSKEAYKARIRRDHELEKRRKEAIWSQQEKEIADRKKREKDEERLMMENLFNKKSAPK